MREKWIPAKRHLNTKAPAVICTVGVLARKLLYSPNSQLFQSVVCFARKKNHVPHLKPKQSVNSFCSFLCHFSHRKPVWFDVDANYHIKSHSHISGTVWFGVDATYSTTSNSHMWRIWFGVLMPLTTSNPQPYVTCLVWCFDATYHISSTAICDVFGLVFWRHLPHLIHSHMWHVWFCVWLPLTTSNPQPYVTCLVWCFDAT